MALTAEMDDSTAAEPAAETPTEKIDLTVFIRPSYTGKGYLAICYEWNLAAGGNTPHEAFENLRDVLTTAADLAKERGEDVFGAFIHQKPNLASEKEFLSFKVLMTIAIVLACFVLPFALFFFAAEALRKHLLNLFRKYTLPADTMLCPS